MPYAIITRDKPNSLQLRNEVRQPHLEYLTANKDKLLAAGAQVDDAGQGGYGGIIIVDTEDRAEAERFIQNDRSPRPDCSPASRWCAGARPSSTRNA